MSINYSREFVPFEGISVAGVITVLSLKCLVVLSVCSLVLFMIFDTCLSCMLVEVRNAVLLVALAVGHRLHDVVSVSVWILLLVNLIWSQHIVVLPSEVDELWFL